MTHDAQVETQQHAIAITDPPIARFLLTDVRVAWLLLPLRLWVGWQWLSAGWEKFQNPAWIQSGSALQAFWAKAGTTGVTFDWYGSFLQLLLNAQAYVWFGKLVTFGEMAIGLGLILGAFTGLAAFFGGFMNLNFIMAGSASSNGLLFAAATILVLSWKTAGWIGLDRWLLGTLGTPWRPGRLLSPEEDGKLIHVRRAA